METVLVIAPHPDDEVIGVGGTIIKKADSGARVVVCIVTKPDEKLYNQSLVMKGRKEAEKANKVLGTSELIFLDIAPPIGSVMPQIHITKKITELVNAVNPDEVYLPHWGDIHKDHKEICSAAMVALRPVSGKSIRILAYETLSETGWDVPNSSNVFIPNVFENIESTFVRKNAAIACYESQIREYPAARSIEAIEALSKVRGASVGVPLAEAFQLIREIR